MRNPKLESIRKSFATQYVESGDFEATCNAFGWTRERAYAVLRTPECQSILAENQFIRDQQFAFTQFELEAYARKMLGVAMGEIEAPMVVTDRDGGVMTHMVKKVYPDMAGKIFSEMLNVGGYKKPDVLVDARTVVFEMAGDAPDAIEHDDDDAEEAA